MGLLRMLFWVALFLVSTFGFTVLFEHGTTDYFNNCQREWDSLVSMYHTQVDGKPIEKKP